MIMIVIQEKSGPIYYCSAPTARKSCIFIHNI